MSTDSPIIDAHTHVHAIPGHLWDSPPERLIKLMDKAGIDQSIIMPYGEVLPGDLSLMTQMQEACERFPDRLIAFARMHPGGGDEGLLVFEKAVREQGFKGLKFHPVGTMVHPSDDASVSYVEKARELGCPVLFHCGDEEFTLPYQIAKLLERVPDVPIILGHMGGYFHSEDALRVAEKYPHCYLETSACPDPRVIRRAVENLGAERLIFGSDGPGCLPALELHKIKALNLGPEREALILHGNMARLLEGVRV